MRSFAIFSLAALALAQQPAPRTVAGLKAPAGLAVTLWAAEPLLTNPTNIDIDERGRIWVLEAVNYRKQLRGEKDVRANGDRIRILEDTDLDGIADKATTFDENISLRAPIGIAVLGDKVYISQSPDLIVYTKDATDKIVSKEILLTGWKGIDHDHGLHAVKFGPDGRLYFNHGDQGFDVTDRAGRRIVSSRQGPYYAGAAMRMNPDATGLEIIAHNFRNPYELALDSFGNIWQTDNDDDGNAWTRVNYVLPGGNYGYWGPGGRNWRDDKGSHFHEELPGVMPNIQRMGAGSPCGLTVYEGKLLPARYRGQPIHAEAGQRVIRGYLMEKSGAGYKVITDDLVTSTDTWFRPSDVAIAPDGSLFVADWYDPGVGGHQMGDIARGRIYRIAPPNHQPTVPVPSLDSPAQSSLYLAWTTLRAKGSVALPELRAALTSGDRILRARALWLIGRLPEGAAAIREAAADADPDTRITALRILGRDAAPQFVKDVSPQVRREAASLLRDVGEEAVPHLIELARRWDGADRWYLEALAIGARGKENSLYEALRATKLDSPKLTWVLRPSAALPDLISNAASTETLAAFAAPEAAREIARRAASGDAAAFTALNRQLFSEWIAHRKDPAIVAAIRATLAKPATQLDALTLADDLEDPEYAPELLDIAKSSTAPEENRLTAIQALGKTRKPEFIPALESLAAAGPVKIRARAVRALGFAKGPGHEPDFRRIVLGAAPNEVRAEAVRILGRSDAGVNVLLSLEQSGTMPVELRTTAAQVANSNRNPAIRARAAKILPVAAAAGNRPLPPAFVLLRREGDVERGRKIFHLENGPKCAGCHLIADGKRKAGPALTTIGSKLGKDALLDSILNPSAGIAPEFAVWILDTRTQGEVIGILAEDTPQRIVVRTEQGEEIRLKPAEVRARRKSKLSMMPEDLVNRMTEQQLVDVVVFLQTLR